MQEVQSVVIVGGGQAGARCAQALRNAGFPGQVTIVGDEPHLPYERPALSKATLLDPQPVLPLVLPQTHLAAQAIELHTQSQVTAIDRAARSIEMLDGSHIAYDRLVIATGARARRLTLEGADPASILTLRDWSDSLKLRERLRSAADLVVIGGGFIGLEVAASASALGCQVTVIEAAQRLLPRLGCQAASDSVLAHHQALGIDVRLGTFAVAKDKTHLLLSDGSEVPADLVLAGIGISPETGLAEAAGLDVDDGILVDQFGATLDPAIYAAGDVTRHYNPVLGRHVRLESWQNANVQAEAVGRTLAGIPTASAEIPWLWSDQGGLNLQVAGAPRAVDRTLVRGDPAGEEGMSVFQFENERLVGGITLNRGREMPLIRRLLAQPELSLDLEALVDPSFPLRRLMPARAAA